MTMVTLIGNPVRSVSLSASPTLPKVCRTLLDPSVSNATPQQHETNTFSTTACLRDIPTYVSTTAAAPDTDDDADDDDDYDRHRPHPSLITDNTSVTTNAFLQQFDDFYNKFLHFNHSTGVSTASTVEEQNASIPAVATAADSDPSTTQQTSLPF